VLPLAAQLGKNEFVQFQTAQLNKGKIVQPKAGLFEQTLSAQIE